MRQADEIRLFFRKIRYWDFDQLGTAIFSTEEWLKPKESQKKLKRINK